jgi:hypothetical protein
MFSGSSNWRGPIWMPVNALIICALLNVYYGDSFKVECPNGSGQSMNLFEVATEIGNRLMRTFLRDMCARCPVHGGVREAPGLSPAFWLAVDQFVKSETMY